MSIIRITYYSYQAILNKTYNHIVMENLKTKHGKSYSSICGTRIYSGDNDELICIKTYKGDWGDWDEKPEHSNFDCTENQNDVSENNTNEEHLI